MADSGDRSEQVKRIIEIQRDIRQFGTTDLSLSRVYEDVTPRQMKALLLLNSRDNASAPMGWLAASLGVTLPTVTGIVDRLVENKLVERLEEPTDRRVVLAHITDKGFNIIEKWNAAADEYLLGVLGRLTNSELAQTTQALEILLRHARDLRQEAMPSSKK